MFGAQNGCFSGCERVRGDADPAPVMGRRFARISQEAAVELGERLETGVKGCLSDTRVGLPEKAFGFLYSAPVYEFGKGHERGLLEDFAEVEGAHSGVGGDGFERQRFAKMGLDELLGSAHRGRLGFLLLEGDSSGEIGKLGRERSEQRDDPFVLFRRNATGLPPSLFQILKVVLTTGSGGERAAHVSPTCHGIGIEADLAGFQMGDDMSPRADGDRRFDESGGAGSRASRARAAANEALMGGRAAGAASRRLLEQLAEAVLTAELLIQEILVPRGIEQ